ncbi:DUF1835 domain-containing protein [Paenibacillus beijingensis]|uniref:ECF subfamily RNA polymerase sigma-24 factor n=1 Tax=Paenibacillus beijingensis TaxID=1126833 RepID=A0A0D5NMY9_9BACL|nr:DUF1835 domain-containing protein [Paenibacillus beijingensis]AJY76664.1 ECF subfamily RNA polymerase sigma-24 factor [Paenibacillus beijingensis]
MLHIVNGDSVADKLRQTVVQGDILVWRELYSEGPVFDDPAQQSHRSVRAQYLERTMGIPAREYIAGCEAQEKALADFSRYKEIVLWFEYDLFDQTMLCYLLHWFSGQSLGHTKLSLLNIDSFPGIDSFRGLGQLSVKQLEQLLGAWHPVQQEQLDLGAQVWEAYASPEPGELVRLLAADTSALPFVHDAFQLHLSRLPSVYNGLGIVEQTTLEILQRAPLTTFNLFAQAGDRLHVLGMGDLQYWHCLAKMSQSPHPLLHIEGLTSFPNYKNHSPSFGNCAVRLTELGRVVLSGEKDWMQVNGIDEWYGGVHLHGHLIQWRWDSSQNMVVST